MGFLTDLLEQYGYLVLFLSLLLEMLALPLPGEVLMTYAGLIVYQGKLNYILIILAGGIGTSIGMTASYFIGYRLGYPFFEKYGSKFHLGPDKLKLASGWFDRYGDKLLLVAYYIPGVRHFTGYFSGVTRMPFRKYAAYAYTGAFIWVAVFITIGKLFGEKWEQYHHTLNRYLTVAGVLAGIVIVLVFVFRTFKSRMRQAIDLLLDKGLLRYYSVGKVEFIAIAGGVFFFALYSFAIGLGISSLGEDFAKLNEMITYFVGEFFDSHWTEPMNGLAVLSSPLIVVPVTLATCAWVWSRGKGFRLEIAFYAIVFAGGIGMVDAWKAAFRVAGVHDRVLAYPSTEAWLTIAGYGYAAYLLVRHQARWANQFVALYGVAACCVLVFISHVFLREEEPGNLVAGFLYGGVWLGLSVLWLELYRSLIRKKIAVPVR
ncbi:VTT domain-containing protein [Cohnella suwonensis]|uniref:VTT domain-containing protein n=1 Tax=Cohnella suwonensis TaxID=696072 RepID=A0ABW0M2Q1_9BACL